MKPVEHAVRTHDGIELLVRRYVPAEATDDARTLVIVHGASEHGARYDHVAQLFATYGWSVLVGDNRGHGRSGGVAMHVRRFEDYLRDLDSVWQYFELRPTRTAMLGHSFGSLICARFAETRPDKLAALVMMAPLLRLKVPVNPLVIGWGKLVSFLAPMVRFESRVDPKLTTRDPVRLAEREVDASIHRTVTCGWFFEMKAALRDVRDDVAALRVPLLMLQGGADQVVDPECVRPWLDTVPSSDKELMWLPDHFHELHNEPDWHSTMLQVVSWLDERLKPKPARSQRGECTLS